MAAGIAWMSLMRVSIKGLGLVSTIVLARLLAPADFGLVAMAMAMINALELFGAFNFDVALIQRQDASRESYDTAWTLNILLGITLALLLLVISFPAADFYNEPRLRAVMHVLALGVLVNGFENIGVVAFRKDLDFRKEFILRVVQKACTALIGLPLAFLLRNYWALVIGMVSGNVLSVLMSYYAHSFRPRLSLAARSHLFSFSKWLMVNNVLWFVRDRTPDFLLGRISGAGALGLYTVSYEISNLPTSELVSPINRAVLPAYAKMANDLESLRQGFLNVIGLIALLALPAGFGIAATSQLIVGVVLGDKWADAAPLISILGIVGALNALQTNCGNVHYAVGRPRTMTVIGGIHVAILLPLLIWGAFAYGALGIAAAYLASVALVSVPVNYAVIMRRLQLPLARMASILWRPVIATGVMYGVTVTWVGRSDAISFALLVGAIAIGVASYGTVIALAWLLSGRPEGPEATFTDKFLLPFWARIARPRVAGH
jgi:lipopolysaccharide exporter